MALERPKPGVPPFSAPLSRARRAEMEAALEALQDAPATPHNLAVAALVEQHLAHRKDA